MEEIVIVGGGVAGLACLNALLDHAVSPLLLEGQRIGTPKMCGEFLAPPALSLLELWRINTWQPIHEVRFYSKNKSFTLDFPTPAGAISRSEVELKLAARAEQKGGRVREETFIKKIIPATATTPYIFELASGETITAKTAIFATGKWSDQTQTPVWPYHGIKLHFNHVIEPSTLLMFSEPDAYFGIVPVSNQTSNSAFLIKRKCIETAGSAKQYFEELQTSHPFLKKLSEHMEISDWFEGRAPAFQLRDNPAWPNSYWIGDALAGLHPAIGSGFYHGMQSGKMAAAFYLQNNPDGYQKAACKAAREKLFFGKIMHHLMLNPPLSRWALPLLKHTPLLLNNCLKQLGYQS
jgi:flavin-dependent dehydrogenase